MLTSLRQLFGLEERRRLGAHGVVVLLGILSSLLEIVGVGAVFPLIFIAIDPGRLGEFPPIEWLRDALGLGSHATLLAVCAALLVAVTLLRLLVRLAYYYLQATVSLRSGQRIGERLLELYLRMPYATFVTRDLGTLVRNVTLLPYGAFAGSAMAFVNLLTDGVVVLGLLGLMAVTQPQAMLAAVAVVGGVLALIYPWIRRRNVVLGAEANRLAAVRIAVTQQSLGDTRLLRVVGAYDYVLRANRRMLDRYYANSWRQQFVAQLPGLVVEGALICGLVAMVVALVFTTADTSEMLASLALFGAAAVRLLGVFNRIMSALGTLQRHQVGLATIVAELATPVEPAAPAGADAAGLPFQNEIRFEGVTFCHAGRPEPALSGIDLVIRRGEMIGILGPSGAGKSTLIDLLIGVLTPDQGRILVDGVPISADPGGWRRNIALVPQKVFLLDESIRRNVAFAMRSADIDAARVDAALAAAQLGGFVASLPQGADTPVGVAGGSLSGGQLQRLGLARALFLGRPLLVLDEATSALDAETEAGVIAVLAALRRRYTIVIVSHRFAALRACDRVVVLRDGRIEAEGPFEDLQGRNDTLDRLLRSGTDTAARTEDAPDPPPEPISRRHDPGPGPDDHPLLAQPLPKRLVRS